MFEAFKIVAAATKDTSGSSLITGSGDKSGTTNLQQGHNTDLMAVVNLIINVVLGLVGLVAVVMLILGGIQYTTSSGDAAKVKKAKDTILYGIIGLVVALLAFAIVNFVLGNIFG